MQGRTTFKKLFIDVSRDGDQESLELPVGQKIRGLGAPFTTVGQ